jgi:mono/diheme cytochrome c family protein
MAAFLLGAAGLASAPAGAEEPVVPPLPTGDADRGKAIFNGVGGCANCHGTDGYIGRRPHRSDALTRGIAKLNPQPADLRNAAVLKAQDEAQRFLSIKFGHPSTAMYPKKNLLLDREIADVLAYLSVLRAEGSAPSSPSAPVR